MSLMDGPSNTDNTRPGHGDLPHDQAVTLRPSEPTVQSGIPDTLPAPAAAATPLASPTIPSYVEPVSADPSQMPDEDGRQPLIGGLQDGDQDNDQGYEQPEVAWKAAEFIAHPKTAKWYAGLAGVTVAVTVLAFLLTRDIMTVIVILICAVLFGYMAARKPRVLAYGLSDTGIYVGNKYYPYKDFNAFSIVDEGEISSIDFMPLKRFAPMLSIYCDPSYEDGVMNILTQHLPFKLHQRTAIDGLMHRIRF